MSFMHSNELISSVLQISDATSCSSLNESKPEDHFAYFMRICAKQWLSFAHSDVSSARYFAASYRCLRPLCPPLVFLEGSRLGLVEPQVSL